MVAACLFAAGLITGPGCSDAGTRQQPSPVDRALSDPMGYGPKPGKSDLSRRAGEASSAPSDRESFNRELQRVLDP